MTSFIIGAAGSGKTTELLRSARDAAQSRTVLMTSSSLASVFALRQVVDQPTIVVRAIGELAFEMLPGAHRIDDVTAAKLFEDAAQPLLQLEWAELMEAELDPEVPGLRAPQRFLEGAFRLVCKLRDALISPEKFLENSLRGATEFYAKPPNLAHPDLLYYTKDSHRDSLHADATELQRQYRREVDLAKILARLYRTYLDHPIRAGCLTQRDAVADAIDLLARDPALAQAFRSRYPNAYVDDAQDLTLGELQLLQALYGQDLENVVLAGDVESSTSAFRGARPDRVFASPGSRTVLEQQWRSPFAVDIACRHLLGTPGSSPISSDERIGLTLFRSSTQRAEAQFIAEHVVELLSQGAPHDEIAVLFRSVATIGIYREALLARGVAVATCGDVNVFCEPEALDALAILWFVADPYRHEYLLRVLSGPLLALSDASVVALCSEPPDAQTSLFAQDAAPNAAQASRWNPKRDVRLAWNVLCGERDADLSDVARTRLTALREKRVRWLRAINELPLPDLIETIWHEGLARAGGVGSAHAAYQQLTLARLYRRVEAFAREHSDGSLLEFLAEAESRMHSAFESHELGEVTGAVRLANIESARGRQFDHVIVPNARAGSFPCWYVPDAFVYSPSLGMIAKENVGDAKAARTAKFTYYMFRTKARESFNLQERRAFVYALRRARKSALVSACGKATRGVSAPEFLAELQAARLPGAVDVSDRWHPTRTMYAG